MTTLFVTIAVFGGLMGAMAVGVIFANKPLAGSCGGPGGPDCACEKAGKVGACEIDPKDLSTTARETIVERRSPDFRAPGSVMQLGRHSTSA